MFDRQQSIGEAQAIDLTSNDQTMPQNKPTRTVYCSGAGVLNVELVLSPGVTTSYTVTAGSRHPIRVIKFIRLGTTATGIVAEF